MNKLSTAVSGALLGLAVAGMSMSAFAAAPTNKAPTDHATKHQEARLNHMQKALDLTADQRNQLQAVYKQAREERQELRGETRDKVQEILTSEQRTKLKERRAQHHAKGTHKMRRHHKKCDGEQHKSGQLSK